MSLLGTKYTLKFQMSCSTPGSPPQNYLAKKGIYQSWIDQLLMSWGFTGFSTATYKPKSCDLTFPSWCWLPRYGKTARGSPHLGTRVIMADCYGQIINWNLHAFSGFVGYRRPSVASLQRIQKSCTLKLRIRVTWSVHDLGYRALSRGSNLALTSPEPELGARNSETFRHITLFYWSIKSNKQL